MVNWFPISLVALSVCAELSLGQTGRDTGEILLPEVWAVESTLRRRNDRPASGSRDPIPEDSIQMPAAARVASADNEFGVRLLRELCRTEPEQNVSISPLSVAMALGLTYNGARAETKQAMAQVLGLEGIDAPELAMDNAALLAALASADPKVVLEIANSLWARRGIPLAEPFIQASEAYYEAEVSELDFSDPEAPALVNDWVAHKTHGRIKKVLDRVRAEDVLFLLNAVYFKGAWTNAFDTKLTRERDFHLPGGRTISHPMMSQSGEYRYRRGDGFKAVSLPYGNGRVSMYVFLPDQGSSLKTLVGRLKGATVEDWLGQMRLVPGDVVLPKLKLEYTRSLVKPLSTLGMAVAFDPAKADFEGMLPAPIDMPFYLNEVKHKTYVEVNEEGTEAAAVTEVGVALAAMPLEEERFAMVVDRPFLYLIQDNRTGAILFIGAVSDPTR